MNIIDRSALKYCASTNTLSVSCCCIKGYARNDEILAKISSGLNEHNTHPLSITKKAMIVLQEMQQAPLCPISRGHIITVLQASWKNPNMIIANPDAFAMTLKNEHQQVSLKAVAKPLQDALSQMGNSQNRALVEDEDFLYTLADKARVEKSLLKPLQAALNYTSLVFNRTFQDTISSKSAQAALRLA